MQRAWNVFVGLAVVAILVCGRGTAADDKTELDGTWELVAFERDGKERTPGKDVRAVMAGNKFMVMAGDKVVAAGTTTSDPTKKPKVVDTTYTEGPDKGKTFKGIYQRDGDTLKFCRATAPDQPRPTEFKTSAETG